MTEHVTREHLAFSYLLRVVDNIPVLVEVGSESSSQLVRLGSTPFCL